jgi:hypothetical protein
MAMAMITSPLYGGTSADSTGGQSGIPAAPRMSVAEADLLFGDAEFKALEVEKAIAGFKTFKESADVGTIPGKLPYDYAYSLSLGVEESDKNIPGAIHFCKVAAEAGYAKAKYRYGALLSKGIDVQQNTVAARSLLEGAYNQLFEEYVAQYRLVNAESSVDEKNELSYAGTHVGNVKGDLWQVCLKHAKDTSDPESIRIVFRLGAYHISDTEVRGSLTELADRLNIPAAQYEYGLVLQKEGKIAEARASFRKAAHGGFAQAQYKYSIILLHEGDWEGSNEYLELADAQGHAAAREDLNEMAESSEDESAAPAPVAGIKRRRSSNHGPAVEGNPGKSNDECCIS